MNYSIETCFTPKLFGEITPNNENIVVLNDILRATTSICTAFQYGVKEIVPVASNEIARQKKAEGYLVACEQDGKKLDFADLGNSAFNFMIPAIAGQSIVYSTTNGTKALDMIKAGGKVCIGAFVNISALAEWIIKQKRNVILVGSGWKNRFNLEDSLFSGALATKLLASGNYTTQCDSTHAAMDLWSLAERDLFTYLEKIAHRHRLKNLQLDDVLPYTFTPDSCPVVPILENGILIKADL